MMKPILFVSTMPRGTPGWTSSQDFVGRQGLAEVEGQHVLTTIGQPDHRFELHVGSTLQCIE